MSWVDDLLSSSYMVWALIGFGIFSLYLKKTGKTVLDVIHDLQEFFSKLTTEEPTK